MKLGERIVISSVIVSLLFTFTVLIYCFTTTKTENTKIRTNTRVYEMIPTQESVIPSFSVPIPEPINGHDAKVVNYILPEISKSNTCIMYKSLYTATRVYVDGEFVTSYGTKEQLPYGNIIGNIRVIVPMKPEYSGKLLTVVYSQIYNLDVDTPIINLGASDDLKLKVIHDNLWRIVLSVFLLVVIVTCFGLSIYQFITNTIHTSLTSYMYLGGFVTTVMIWIICSSDIPQFYTNANGAVALLSYMSLATMGIPFVGYCAETFTDHKKFLHILEGVGCLVPFLMLFLFLTGICDPPETVLIAHADIFIIIVSTVIIAIREWRTNKGTRLFAAGIFILIITAIIGFAFYYVSPEKGYDALAFGFGFFAFILDLLGIMLLRESKFIKESLSMEIYKEMAFEDKLTGCGNRAALENEVKEGVFYGEKPVITFGIFDLNNLKAANDEYGHAEGDKLIMAASNCLTNASRNLGKVYRLGGDEFAVVFWNNPGKQGEFYKKLEEEMDYYNQEHEVNISMAKGMVERTWLEGDKFFYKLYHDADEIMYEDKEKYHQLNQKNKEIGLNSIS